MQNDQVFKQFGHLWYMENMMLQDFIHVTCMPTFEFEHLLLSEAVVMKGVFV